MKKPTNTKSLPKPGARNSDMDRFHGALRKNKPKIGKSIDLKLKKGK